MKKIFMLSILLLVLSIMSCGKSTESVKDKVISTTSSKNNKTNIEITENPYNTYSNSRYGFSVKYPSDWTAGEESDNGDGKLLYVGNPNIDIRVYATHYIENISDPYHHDENNKFQLQRIKLDDEKEATLILGKQEGKVLYEMVYISKEKIEYHFYANVNEEFFQDNEKILLEIVKSMKVPE